MAFSTVRGAGAFGLSPGGRESRVVSMTTRGRPGGPDPTQYIQQYQEALNAANAANEKRYKELLASIAGLGQQVGGTFNQALGEVQTVGDAQIRDVNQASLRQAAAQQQALLSRGLSASTAAPAVARGVEADRQQSLARIHDWMAGQRAGVLQNRAGAEMQVGGMRANAIEGRTDAGPSTSLYTQLIQQLAGAAY